VSPAAAETDGSLSGIPAGFIERKSVETLKRQEWSWTFRGAG